jgi:hypothetical protein
MGSQWPPSPHVEDEESALKHEITHKSEFDNKRETEEARCRGTVDQYPIILDTNRGPEPKHDYTSSTDNEGESIRTQSSDDSYGPPTPPNSKTGRKHAQHPQNLHNTKSRSGKATPPSDITKDAKEEVTPRGRPDMPRIHTDLGSDLQGMITGQRRAPSPYAYARSDTPAKPDTPLTGASYKRFSGNTFLSPASTAPSQSLPTADNNKRPSSARPRSKPRLTDDSDDSSDTEQRRRRHHSRQRSTRDTLSKAQLASDEGRKKSIAAEKRSTYYAYPQPKAYGHSRKDSDVEVIRRTDANDRPTKRFSKDSPYTSSAEDSWSKSHSDFVSKSDKRVPKESPYTSSAEEGRETREDATGLRGSDGRRSHRSSMSRKERPRLDLSGHQYSYHGAPTEERRGGGKYGKHGKPLLDGRSYLEPSSLRSPRAMEEYLEKVFKDSKVKSYKESPHPSPCGSPLASPPRSPPRTPRVEKRSKDYFSLKTSAPLHPSESIRPSAPSHGEGQYNHMKPLASVLAAAAGVRAVPSLSRSSTSSTEMHSSGNLSKSVSGRRSRNSSPIRDERPPIARSGHENEKGAPKAMRDEERPNSRPVSISGSTSYIPPPSASSDRFSIRSGSYTSQTAEIPRLSQRTFSYSGANEAQHLRRPSSAKSSQLHFGPPLTPNQTPSPTMPRLPRSPSSSEKTPRLHQLSELPPCPRSKPEAGHYDWHTVVDMPELDICPSCMTVIGASRFRDVFVPSTSKVGQKIVCDFSRPWVRNAWAQIIKQRRNSLGMIHQIIRNSETTKPCPGKGSDVRAWYRLPDPDTGNNVPNFDACSECVRSIEIIFPQLQGIFKRSSALVQERTCDLNTQSKRFDSYLRLLDAAALQYDVDRLREPNIKAFANYARNTARVRECTRDDMVLGQLWHFIPSLPEFTICEECFEQVVWPVADQPVASGVNRTLQLVPGTQRNTGVSCQLYSERMRKKFLEAVKYADFEFLKQVALRRHGVEILLQEKHKLFMNDMAMGKDRTAELQANIEEWRKWE